MKKYLLFFLLILSTLLVFAQQNTDAPIPVTPAIAQKINAEIEKEVPAFLIRLEKGSGERTDKFDESIKFGLDTFKIESFFRKSMDYDYSTVGMNKATSDAATKYDALLNKYYKLLAAKLKPADKAILLNAQKSWLVYRDNEVKLYSMIAKDEYSGGGTIQSTIGLAQYLDIIKARVLQLFDYYVGMYN